MLFIYLCIFKFFYYVFIYVYYIYINIFYVSGGVQGKCLRAAEPHVEAGYFLAAWEVRGATSPVPPPSSEPPLLYLQKKKQAGRIHGFVTWRHNCTAGRDCPCPRTWLI